MNNVGLETLYGSTEPEMQRVKLEQESRYEDLFVFGKADKTEKFAEYGDSIEISSVIELKNEAPEIKFTSKEMQAEFQRVYESLLSESEKLKREHSKNLDVSSEFISQMDDEKKQNYLSALKEILSQMETGFLKTKNNNGHIAQFYDYLKNQLGIEYGSEAVQKHIDTLQKQIGALESGKAKDKDKNLAELYYQITGSYLNAAEEEKIKKSNENGGSADSLFCSSPLNKRIMDFTESSANADDYASFAAMSAVWTASTVVSMTPFAAASIAFWAGYAPHIYDGVTEKDGYSLRESAADFLRTAAYTAVPAAGKAAAAKFGLGTVSAAAGIGAMEKTARYFGKVLDGNAAFNAYDLMDNMVKGGITGLVKIPSKELTKLCASWLPNINLIERAGENSAGLKFLAGFTDGYIKNAASYTMQGFFNGNMSYLAECARKGKPVDIKAMLGTGLEKMQYYSFTGLVLGGAACELLSKKPYSSETGKQSEQNGADMPKNAVIAMKNAAEDGTEYLDYFDKDGLLLARDMMLEPENGNETQIYRITPQYVKQNKS